MIHGYKKYKSRDKKKRQVQPVYHKLKQAIVKTSLVILQKRDAHYEILEMIYTKLKGNKMGMRDNAIYTRKKRTNVIEMLNKGVVGQTKRK